jgi:N-acetylmuramoyl-L-alanine amidase
MRWIEVLGGKAAGLLILLAAVSVPLSARAQSAPSAPPSMPTAPPSPAAPIQPKFIVVLDAAHGGSDSGAHLRPDLQEKDVTLALTNRLRSTLQARGFTVVTTRESDATLSALNRAQTANHAQAAACLVLHATATGSGVHLYASSLNPISPGRLQPWQTAQAAWVTQSLKLESEIDSALAHAQIPITLGRASVQPMDNLTCPAIAVEVAPLVGGHVTTARDVSDAAYQKSVVDALAAAIDSWRSDWKQ